MKTSNEFEQEMINKGMKYIIGIDEAGRGPIAGPLVVAAVRFKNGYEHDEIYDSKKLTHKKRKALFKKIINDADEYYIKIVNIETIDNLNIYRATQLANVDLVNKFKFVDAVLTDAMPLNINHLEVKPIIKGDQKSVSIAAASILAKVVRDGIMQGYDILYPNYLFAKNKGYPTPQHLKALNDYGVLSIHRKSYGPVSRKLQLELDLFRD